MLAQAITAMAHHRYLELDGGQNLVDFIVRQCAVDDDTEVGTWDHSPYTHAQPR